MAVKIILAVCMLPVFPMMFGVCWFLAGEKDGTQFGVTLWNGAREQPQVLEIKRIYKKELAIDSLICLLLFFLTLLPKYESLVVTGMVAWMFFVIVFLLLPFRSANRRMKEQKQEYLASLPERENPKEEIWIDVTAAGTKRPEISKKSLYAGCVFALLAPVAEIFLYGFWRCPWLPELWILELVLLSIAGAAWCFPLYLRFLEKQRIKALTFNSQVNLQVAGLRRYHWNRFGIAMAWLTGLFNWGMLGSFYVPTEWFPWLVGLISLLFGTVSVAMVFSCWKKIEKNSRKYLAQEPLVEEDDDRYWIWGMIYYNKNDSRKVVEQRAGIGTTVNMAKPGIKYATIIMLAFLAIFMFGVCGWCMLEEFTPVTLWYEDGMLTAKHWKNVYQINQKDIEQIVLLEEEPKIRRKSGTGMETVQKGDFYSDTYQRDFKVCLNPEEPPFLMIESADGRWYLLGGSDGGAVQDIYEKLEHME